MTGILCLNKPEGITSFGAVAKVRRLAGEKKAGHAGTLDPMATGVLPILFGGATRFLELLPEQGKGYRAVFQLGMTTDTLDRTGTILTTAPVSATSRDVARCLDSFRGRIFQTPPMYSALSQNGVRLYELARQGIEVERPSREITIFQLDLESAQEEKGIYELSVRCSKGTYIRSLVDDIGKALGCGAVLLSLCRTFAAGFSLQDCVSLEELGKRSKEDFPLIPLEQALTGYPAVSVSGPQSIRFQNGGALDLQRIRPRPKIGLVRVESPEGLFLGIGEADDQELKVKRLLVRRD